MIGVIPMLTVIINIIFFYIERGPNADIYFIIIVFTILSVLGVLFAILSWKMSKRLIFLIVGLIGNGFVLVVAYLLLLAMGISEP
ncbi:hypothetical protein D8M04_18785 [Oceanobacillus piezotolerans]|uniref:Uncharacterized protein n=2 Tax=Oceanobacillus piezotolerans TaxID=2448030 RepID=A0A498DHW9_9BACI|nr:hypothetical protein [Oceanobacillus piezotolerans]RLL40636.1 hypothetical protein D8M04_18785 [Oceanobacillus piezotolerans]